MNAQYILLWKRQVAVQLIVPIPIKIEKIVRIKNLFFYLEINFEINITKYYVIKDICLYNNYNIIKENEEIIVILV